MQESPIPPTPEPVEPIAPSTVPTLDQATPQAVSPTPSPALEAEMVDDGTPEESSFVWQASEYLHHSKGASWYGGLGLIVLILLLVAYLTRQWLSIGVFVVMAVAVVVYARKPPRTLTYELTNTSIVIDGRPYPYTSFRSFAVLPDMAWHTIDLEPTQRFMPRLSILFENDSVDTIVGHLSDYLPRVDRKPDAVERLTRYLRF